MQSTTTTTTTNSTTSADKPQPQKPKTDKKPQQPKPKPKPQQPKSENGENLEGSSKTQQQQQPKQHRQPKQPKQQSDSNNTTTTTTNTTKNEGNGEKKSHKGGHGHGHGHSHSHGHGHHHHHNNNNKKQTTTTTTTTTNNKNQQQHQQIKTLEYYSDKSFSGLLDMNRFEKPGIKDTCIVCCDPIVFYGVGVCDHVEVCAFCLLSQRELYNDFKCCICKTESKTIVITDDKVKKFEEYDKSKLSFNSKANIYCTIPEFEKSLPKLWEPLCQVCHASFPTVKKLELHLNTEHALTFCQICLSDRKVFLAQQNLYDPKKLPIHMSEWDGGAGITIAGKKKGHPTCKFCNIYYYGNDQLYDHLNKNHFYCFVCESKGLLYQYFSDFPKIRHHFNAEHHPCMHPDCLEKKFIVFPDEYSLKSHEVSVHLDTSKMSKGQRRNATQVNMNFERTSSSFSSNTNSQSLPSADAFSTNLSGQQIVVPRNNFPTTTTTTTTTTNNNNNSNNSSSSSTRTNNLLNAPAPSTFNPDFHSEKEKEKEITQSELDERNKKLVAKIQTILNNDKKYASFKALSVDFKNGKLEPNTYYTKFLGLFGTKANDIFDELIALLPDKAKRDALSQIHTYMKVVEDQYPSLNVAISKKSSKNNTPHTSNIWSTGSSASLSLVKNKPSESVLAYPGIGVSTRTTTTTTTTTTTNTNNNTAASKIKNNNNNQNSATSMAYRLTSSRYIPGTGDSDDSDDESFPSLGGYNNMNNGFGGDRYTSTNNFSKVQVESNKPSLASTLSKVSITPTTTTTTTTTTSSSLPASLKTNKIPTNSKEDFPSLPGSENFVPKKKVVEPKKEETKQEQFIKKGGKQKQVLLRFG